jgi:tRNA (guanine-N7-)-methyltransferase
VAVEAAEVVSKNWFLPVFFLYLKEIWYNVYGDKMRLKNIKGAKEKIDSSPYLIKEYLDNGKPLHIEIGIGKGKFIVEKALLNPEINFIGIEKFDSVLVRAIEKVEDKEIPNLKLMRLDAVEIENIFKSQVDTIYLNFSDPWPKKRHADRRLSSPLFLERYKKISKNNVHIVMKTDNRGLFEYSLATFSEHNFVIEKISLDLYKEDLKDNIQTEYEAKFSGNGDTIYMVEVRQRLDITK